MKVAVTSQGPNLNSQIAPRFGRVRYFLLVDTTSVANKVADLENVGFVAQADLLCSDKEIKKAVGRLKAEGCERLLFVGCSPRSSLKFPEERIGSMMQSVGLDESLFEVANVREQCAWQHSDCDAATDKAVDLVRMAHARLVDAEPAPTSVSIAKKAYVETTGEQKYRNVIEVRVAEPRDLRTFVV